MKQKILFISSLYINLVNNLYKKNKDLINNSYQDQFEYIINNSMSWSNSLLKYFKNFDTYHIIYNVSALQKKWVDENNIKFKTLHDTVIEQIKYYKPTVLFFEAAVEFNSEFYNNIRNLFPFIKIITGHCCTIYSEDNIKSFKKFDVLFTSSPQFESEFKNLGLNTKLAYHSFDEFLLDKIKIQDFIKKRDIIFTGTLDLNPRWFKERTELISYLIKNKIKIDIFGLINGRRSFIKHVVFLIISIIFLPFKTAKIKLDHVFKSKRFSVFYTNLSIPRRIKLDFENNIYPPIFANTMISELANSKICLNSHGGLLKQSATNMRLFEATGAGTCLLTEYRENLKDLFDLEKEIVTYKDREDCLDKIRWLLKNPQICEEIAKAGQAKTLKLHTFKQRALTYENEIMKILNNQVEEG